VNHRCEALRHATNCRASLSRFSPSPAGAFSLVEMLITLALVLVMISMMYGFGSRSHQTEQKAACQKNLQKAYIALEIFANDHAGAFPVKTNARTSEEPLALLVPRYTTDAASFICPGSKDRALPAGEPFAERRISYAYFMGRRSEEGAELLMTDRQVNTAAKAVKQPIFSQNGKPPGNNHHKYGGNYLFCDGSMEKGPALAKVPVVLSSNVVLLNPKP
jgi:type II secretory pathway pseudopilin PulG